jgi:hypothetical protein
MSQTGFCVERRVNNVVLFVIQQLTQLVQQALSGRQNLRDRRFAK